MDGFGPKKDLLERNRWLIRLRWIAVFGVTATIFFVTQVLGFSLPHLPLYALSAILAAYNLLFAIILFRIKKAGSFATINRLANAQISLDLVTLTGLLHFSGGVENPFTFYFVFHMIIAGVLLSRRASFLQATFAALLFCVLAASERFGLFAHYGLGKFIGEGRYDNLVFIAGVSFVFVTTMYIAVYMAASISGKLRQREKTLEEANEQLKEKDRIKSEYVLRVSHDIKEHLAAIQACLEPVVGGIVGELNHKQMDLTQRASQRTSALMTFVKALLEITRIKLSKEIKMEHFSFKDALSEAIGHIALKAKNKNISIISAVEPTIDKIRGGREYIQETIANLLVNSVKYTPRNGKIAIDVSDKGSFILIRIKDTGIGIPEAERPKIFDEFYRASNARQAERDGTGLGLSIAKQIIERHNGKISVESEEGKGSVFSIELPK